MAPLMLFAIESHSSSQRAWPNRARPLRVEFEDAIYHICARGNARQRIFFDERNLAHFVKLLEAPSVESSEPFRESQDAQGNRLIRNSPSETIAPRNRSLVIDRHADQLG